MAFARFLSPDALEEYAVESLLLAPPRKNKQGLGLHRINPYSRPFSQTTPYPTNRDPFDLDQYYVQSIRRTVDDEGGARDNMWSYFKIERTHQKFQASERDIRHQMYKLRTGSWPEKEDRLFKRVHAAVQNLHVYHSNRSKWRNGKSVKASVAKIGFEMKVNDERGEVENRIVDSNMYIRV